MIERNFYTYVDFTCEKEPRAFYVGKGNSTRVESLKRNWKHKKVSKNFGINRHVVLKGISENECLKLETELIAKYHTYVHDELADDEIACNFTTGGDGVADINNRKVQQSKDGVLIQEFKSIREVAEKFGFDPTTLSNAFKGKSTLPIVMREFEWKIAESRLRKKYKIHKNSITILEIDPITNEVLKEHNSITDAIKIIGISYTTFMRYLRAKNDNFFVKKTGNFWRVKDENALIPRVKRSKNSNNPTRSKPVVIYDINGERTFQSVSSAAFAVGVDQNELLKILHNELISENFTCQFLHKKDKKCEIVHAQSWYEATSEANTGFQVVKLDKDGNVLTKHKSIAEAERANNFTERELYTAFRIDMKSTFDYDGFVWKVSEHA